LNTTNTTSYVSSVTGSGTADSILGTLQISVTGTATRERGLNCGDAYQLNLVLTDNNGDTIDVSLFAAVSGFGTPQPFVITGGTVRNNPASGSGTVTLIPNATNTQATGSATGSLTVGTAPGALPPSISPSGIVPVYSSVPIVQPGSWISIFGTNLAPTVASWTGNFPTNLGNVTVSIDGKSAYLWFVSPGQINAQAPNDATPGCVNVTVTTPAGTATSQVYLQPQQPSFNTLSGSKYVAAVIPSATNTGAYGNGTYDLMGPAGFFAFNTIPAKVGSTIELFGVGFGPTLVAVPAGQVLAAPTQTTMLPTVTIGGVNAQVVYAGEIEEGLYQLNVVIPQVPSGDEQIIATVPGANPVLFSADSTQTCNDPVPLNPAPTNCALYVSVK
jgi:uncharacterized protein (TIGR03437 family)